MPLPKKKYSIIIPTYERGEALLRCVKRLKKQPNSEDVDIVISDNCSQDGSWEKIQSLGNQEGISLYRTETNIGFQANLLKLFELAQTEYCIILSDEDDLDLEKLLIIDEIVKPDVGFVSPQAFVNGKIYRGKQKCRSLRYSEFLNASFYISGVIFKVESWREIVSLIGVDELVKKDQVYPHSVVVAAMLARGVSTLYHPAVFASKRENLPTRIDDGKKFGYSSLEARVRQIRLFHDLFERLKNEATNESDIRRWRSLKNEWMRQSFLFIKSGIATSYPESLKEFNKSVIFDIFFGRISRLFARAYRR